MDAPLAEIEGKYEILHKLAEGGMGAVYKVRHVLLGEIRVVKVIRSGFANHPDARERFLREARTAIRLRHPNIAQLYDFSVGADGSEFIVSEFIDGTTLEDLLARPEPLPLSLAVEIARQALSALGYLHRQGFVHRDVSPDNLMVTTDQDDRPLVKLIDLGLAKAPETSNMTQAGTFLGKLRYASPESFAGSVADIDARSDLYAFGLVLCQLLTGRHPIPGQEMAELVAGHVFGRRLGFDQLDPLGRVPPAARETVEKAIALEPGDRFQSAEDFVAALDALGLDRPEPHELEPLRRAVRAPHPRPSAAENTATMASPPWSETTDRAAPAAARDSPAPAGPPAPPPFPSDAAAAADPSPRRSSEPAANATVVLQVSEVARRNRYSRFLGSLAHELLDCQQRREMMERVLGVAFEAFPVDRGFVLLPGGSGGRDQVVARIGDRVEEGPEIEVPISATMLRTVMEQGVALLTFDAQGDQRLIGGESIRIHGIRSAMCAPLWIGDRMIGFMQVDTPFAAGSLGEDDLEFFVTLANYLGVALERIEPATGDRSDAIGPDPAANDAAAAAPPRLSLAVRHADGNVATRHLTLDELPVVIGRGRDCDIPVPDFALSRRHCVIEPPFHLRDLGSTNGTFLNGRSVVAPLPLFFGDVISVGPVTVSVAAAGLRPLPNLVGATVDDRYTLERELHTSLKAATYVAADRQLRRRVVLKIFTPALTGFPTYRDEFMRQAEIAASLKHGAIAAVIDHRFVRLVGNGIDESVLCMCSEYLEGGNLAQRLASGRDITRHESQRWIDRLVGALENAHGHRVVHGGLKPTAVVFDSRGAAHLTDFASSLAGDSPMAAGTHGEPDFLAPEQWDSGVVSPATDQYSLATLAYLLLTGSKPFEGQQHPNIRRQNLRRGPQPAHVEAERSGVDPLPPPVSEVLARGLSAQPADRFESVADFGEALAHALAGRRADPQVFVSYSRATCSGWASYFQTMLHNEHQIRAFVDVKRIDAAGPFPERIRQAIEACDVFVCLLASDSIASAWVRREIDEAHRLGKPMLPVFLESFSDREPSEHESDPAIRALLEFDGVFLLERKHIHVDHTLGELARIVHGTAAGQ